MKPCVILGGQTAVSAAVLWAACFCAKAQQFAVSFDGVNDYVTVPDSPALRITNAITVEAWINRAARGVQMGIVEKYGSGGGSSGGYALRIMPSDTLRFYTLDNGSAASYVDGATALGTNEWYHVAGVWDRSHLLVYVNGVLDGSLSDTRNPKSGTTPLMIGERGTPLGTPFQGELDEVRIWDIARSQAQIAADMARSLSGSESGLIGYWRFNEGSGTNAADSAPAGGFSDGALINGQGWVNSPVPANVPFVDAIARLPGVWHGATAWGDFNRDGRLDLLLSGTTNTSASGAITRVYLNSALGAFSNGAANLAGVSGGAVAWGDFNNDGVLDLLLMGSDATANRIALVYQGQAVGSLTNLNAGLPGLTNGTIAWGDFDNDGRPDILLTGSGAMPITRVYRNNGGGSFADIHAHLSDLGQSAAAWGDYDNDGDLDILLTGEDNAGNHLSQLYRNDGSGVFTLVNASLLGVAYGSVAWGDYDNDGNLDILLAGQDNANHPAARVYHNNGDAAFTDIGASLPGLEYGAAAWGDYNNDGLLDILLTGQDNSGDKVGSVFRNNGNGTFTDINANLPGVDYSVAAWGDFDNDGDLDIVLAGRASSGSRITRIYRNNSAIGNSLPTAPTGLSATLSNSLVTLSWASASDAQTPASGLTYNLRIGTTPQGSDILSPMAGPNGYRRVAQWGNQQHGTTAIERLVPGQPYYWSVQAVDGALAGSPFSSEARFGLALVFSPPENPASPVPGDVNGDGLVDGNELNTVVSNYWPYSPWLQMTNVAGLGGTNVTFAVSNGITGNFGVEYTTNLVDWQFLGPATPRYEFTDTNAPAVPQRFYRLRWP